jgi:EmrB/QacA subfamily drug resistance transporter
MGSSTAEGLGTPAARPPAVLSHADILSIFSGIMLAMLLAALDQTIVATALPTIGRDLGDVADLSWVVTAYLLASTAVTPLYGKFSDTHGRRITLLIGITIFIGGSVLCALAPSLLALVVARFVQGLGGGGLISLAQTIIADIVPPRERGRYQVYIASVFVCSSLAGPVLGGVIADHLHWSLIFWINVPLGALALAMTNTALRRLPRNERHHRLDWQGAVLMAGATITLMLALSWGGAHYAWLSVPILALLVGSAVLWVLFALRLRLAAEPLIPLTVLANPVVRMSIGAACFGMGTYIGLTIFVPIYLETVLGLSASASGLALIPLMCGTVIGSVGSGRAMASLTHYKRIPTAGLVVTVAVTACLAVFAGRMPLVLTEVALGALSLGLGTLFPVATVSVQNAVSPHELGTATATANFFRALGGALMVALLGAVVLGGTGGATLETLQGAPTAAGAATMAATFRWVFAAATAGFALALVFFIAMEERPLRTSAARAAQAAIAD